MKKSLLLALIFLTSISSFGQKIRFSDSTNVWNFFSLTCCNPPTFLPEDVTGYPNHYSGTITDSGITYQYLIGISGFGLIREDTIAKIVYARKDIGGLIFDTMERVLYNYNAVVGDTVNRIISENSFISWVISIDSTLINGIWYKVWRLESSDSASHHFIGNSFFYIIEGIGCTNGLFYPLNPYIEFENSQQLFCFSSHGISSPLSHPVSSWGLLGDIHFDDSISCNVPLMTKEISSKYMATLYPNPITQSSIIQLPCSIPSGTLIITNTLGQIITQTHFKNKQELPIGDLIKSPGIYFYRITDNSNSIIFSGKFVQN